MSKDKKKDKEFNELQLGEYFLHIYIEETSALDNGSPEDTQDIVIEISALGETKKTEKKKGIGYGTAAFYGEHFFFNKEYKDRSELEAEIVVIDVYDSGLVKNSLIGSLEISTSSIYYEKEHTFRHRWMFLSNIAQDYQKIMGYLKFSANFVRSGEKRAELTSSETHSKLKGSNITDLSIPPQFKLERKQLKIMIFRAERLTDMDSSWFGGSSDPYIKVTLGGESLKSRVISGVKKGMVTFNINMYMTIIIPTFLEWVDISLLDKDTLGVDDYFGTSRFRIQDLIKKHEEGGENDRGKYSQPFWTYIYGGPAEYQDKKARVKMDKFPDLASKFKGALYMQLTLGDVLYNANAVTRMAQGEIAQTPPRVRYKIYLELYAVHNVHYKNEKDTSKHYVCVDWGGVKQISKKVDLYFGMLEFYEFIQLEESFGTDDIDQLPDVIVSVVRKSDDVHVSYCRLKARDYLPVESGTKKTAAKYLILNADQAIKRLSDHGAGILHMKLALNHSNRWTQSQTSMFNPRIQRPRMKQIWICLSIYQAKELPAGDEDGSGDPVVHAYHYGNAACSSTKRNTLNPVWNDRIYLRSVIVGDFIPPLIVNVHDTDNFDKEVKTFEFLGATALFFGIKNFTTNRRVILEPKWYKLRHSANSMMGRLSLACAVTAFKAGDPQRFPPERIYCDYKHYLVKVRILGLRNLQSGGILPVKKPYIKINTSTLVLNDSKDGKVPYSDLKTVPKRGGENPNIGEIMNMDLSLPVKDTMKPSISFQVLDQALIGGDDILGNFEVDVGNYSFFTSLTFRERLQHIQNRIKNKDKYSQRCKNALTDVITDINKSIREIEMLVDYSPEELKKIQKEAIIDAMALNKAVTRREKTLDVAKILHADIQPDYKNAATDSKDEDLKECLQRCSTKMSQIEFPNTYTNQNTGGDNKIDLRQDVGEFMKNEIRKYREKSIYKDLQDNEFVIMPKYKAKAHSKKQLDEIRKKIASMGLLDENQTQISPEDEELQNLNQEKRSLAGRDLLVSNQNNESSLKLKTNNHSGQRLNTDNATSQINQFVNTRYEEINIPDPKVYREVGYDTLSRRAKHYRLQLECELEKSPYTGKAEFDSIPIFRGKRIDSDHNWIQKIFGGAETFKAVGKFRGGIQCIESDILKQLEAIEELHHEFKQMDIPYSEKLWMNSQIDKDMLQKVDVMIRVYILDAVLFQSEDIMSKNDPYLILRLGDQVKNCSDSALTDRNEPIFNRTFKFDHTFPGASTLKVEVWDKDVLVDDMIGATEIDLEERFYDQRWRSLKDQPIEKRKLMVMSDGREAGFVNLWVEMYPKRGKNFYERTGERRVEAKNWDISSMPETEFELRVIVWEAKDVPNNDIEDMSDIFVKVALNSLDSDLSSETDTHIRASNGFGSFNWRMKFPMRISEYSKRPEEKEKYRIDFQIWDKDLLSHNDFLSSQTIKFYNLVEEAMMTNMSSKLYKMKRGRRQHAFWIKTKPNPNIKDEKLNKPSKIKISVELVPMKLAEITPVGVGRGDPNQAPYLPPPVGRFQFTWNPFKLIDRLVGPAFKKKCICILIVLCCCGLCILMGPMIFANVITNTITP